MEKERAAMSPGWDGSEHDFGPGRVIASGFRVEDIHAIRRARGRTQGQIAEKMRVSVGAVARIERDPLTASLQDIGQWCEAVGVPVTDVISMWVERAPDVAETAAAEAPPTVDGDAQEWRFVVTGTPRTKRGADKGRRGQMHPDTVAVDYEQRVAGAASDAGLCAGSGPVCVEVTLYLPTRRRKDADRVLSAIFDGLKRAGKAALEDDNLMVVQQTRVALGGIDKLRPRAEVVVRRIQGVR